MSQESETCFGCVHTKNRWRTWRMIPYCLRYRIERNVRCLNFKEKKNGKG